MAYEPKPGQFSLFKNKFKESDKHPDYKGDGMDLEGNALSVAAWLKEDKNGNKFMSCKMEPKKEQARVPGSAKTPVNIDDDIPW